MNPLGVCMGPYQEPRGQNACFTKRLGIQLPPDPDAGFAELTARYQADPRLTVPATVYNGVLNRADEV